jgi:D-threo-aldose 1-dehydrogenase
MDITQHRRIGSTELHCTALGFGSAPLGNRFRTLTEQACLDLVDDAWDRGIRVFDTAPMYGYGLAENRLGTALRSRPRDDYLLSTKVGRLLHPAARQSPDDDMWTGVPPMRVHYDYTYSGAMRSIEDSLQRMLTDHIDIVLIHDCDRYGHGADQPAVFEQAMSGAARALVDLRDQHVIGAVGVGVNEADVCVAAAQRCDFDVFLLAGRYSLLEQDSLDDVMPVCVDQGISLLLGGVYNSGILATGAVPGAHYNYAPASPEIINRVRLIETICAAHHVPIAAVSLQFALAHPAVASVLLGASSPQQQQRNSEAAQTVIPTRLWLDLQQAGLMRPDAPVPSRQAAT